MLVIVVEETSLPLPVYFPGQATQSRMRIESFNDKAGSKQVSDCVIKCIRALGILRGVLISYV